MHRRDPDGHLDLRGLVAPILLAGLVGASVRAQTSYPMVMQVYPTAVQRGTTATVQVIGVNNFVGAYRAVIEGTGVTAEVVPPKVDPKAAKPASPPPVDRVTLKVRAAPDAALGPRELRVATDHGVSSLGQLVVVAEPVVVETEPNDTPAKAQKLTLPCTVTGKLQAAEDVDYYRFTARAGQEISFSVLCGRLEDTIHDLQDVHADPMLTLFDPAGRELAGNDDYYAADPHLSYRVRTTGEYLIQVRDARYRGDARWTYCLTVTAGPVLTNILPMAIRRGSSADVELVGSGLGPARTARVTVPAAWPAGPRRIELRLPQGGTNAVPLLVSDLPELLEHEPNDTPGQAQAIPIPCGVNGRIGAENDADCYVFRATKGQVYSFEIQARRYGSALDSYLSIHDLKGAELTNNDDALGADSALDWTAPADGRYIVRVRDLHDRGGPSFVYHLVATRGGPDFTLQCDDDKMMLGPGGSQAWFILLTRKNGFTGPVRVAVANLPPGVAAAPLTIPAAMTQGCLVLTAAPAAARDVRNVEVTGTATIPGPGGTKRTIRRVAEPLEEIYLPGGGRGRWPVTMHTVSVARPLDLLGIDVKPRAVTLAPGQSATLDVTVRRHAGFTKPVNLDVYLRHLGTVYGSPLPPGVSLDEARSKTLLGAAETRGTIVLKADPTAAPVHQVPVAVLAGVSINFVVKVSYASPPVWLDVAAKGK